MNSVLKKCFFALLPAHMLVRKASECQKVFFTFDDGPHPVQTEKILEILEPEKVKATFFMTGTQVEKFPEIAKKVAARGHEVASHSWFHGKHSHWDFAGLWNEISRSKRIIRETCAVSTRNFRPPYGRITAPLLLFALARQIKIVLWSLDSDDDRSGSSAEILKKCGQIAPGDIVLFHDDNPAVAEALPKLIGELRKRKLGFGTIREIEGAGR